MPTLIHIICALAKCTLSDPSPWKMLQGESGAPVYCRLWVRLRSLGTNVFAKWEGRNKPNTVDNNSPPWRKVEGGSPLVLHRKLRLSGRRQLSQKGLLLSVTQKGGGGSEPFNPAMQIFSDWCYSLESNPEREGGRGSPHTLTAQLHQERGKPPGLFRPMTSET